MGKTKPAERPGIPDNRIGCEKTVIEVKNLTKRYGQNRGVEDISFSVREGEIVGFLGPNGAGKTTTMNILTGYMSPTSGTASVAGLDVQAEPLAAKRHIGYLPEQPPLYTDMTVEEYLNFVYELKGVKASSRSGHLSDIADMVDISGVWKRLIRNLSKGYRQRVGLAQTLIGDPDVLILDEPTVGLDPSQIIEIRNVLKTLGRSRTIILSTHILPEVSAICERVLVISGGVIVADDKPDNLANAMSGERKFLLRVAGPRDAVQTLLRSRDGVKSVEAVGEIESHSYDFLVESLPNVDIRKPLFHALAAAELPILMLRPQNASLEDIFIKLTEDGAVPPETKRGSKTPKRKPDKPGGEIEESKEANP